MGSHDREEVPMHARVVRGSAWRSEDEGRRFIEERVIPSLREQRGFISGYWLYNRATSRLEAVTLWESEEAIRASDELARRIRDEANREIDARFEAVEEFEVIAHESRSGAATRAQPATG